MSKSRPQLTSDIRVILLRHAAVKSLPTLASLILTNVDFYQDYLAYRRLILHEALRSYAGVFYKTAVALAMAQIDDPERKHDFGDEEICEEFMKNLAESRAEDLSKALRIWMDITLASKRIATHRTFKDLRLMGPRYFENGAPLIGAALYLLESTFQKINHLRRLVPISDPVSITSYCSQGFAKSLLVSGATDTKVLHLLKSAKAGILAYLRVVVSSDALVQAKSTKPIDPYLYWGSRVQTAKISFLEDRGSYGETRPGLEWTNIKILVDRNGFRSEWIRGIIAEADARSWR